MINTINFSYNWNNKLNNKAFTTLRIHNSKKYKVGNSYEIEFNGTKKGKAKLFEKRVLRINQLNNFICFLDTGYCRAETLKILERMYNGVNLNNVYFDFCLLVYSEQTQQKKQTKQLAFEM